MDRDNWVRFVRCLIDVGSEVFEELLHFYISIACFDGCRKLWQMKAEQCVQSSRCKELWISLCQQFSHLDEVSQHILQPIISALSDLTRVEKGQQLPVLIYIKTSIQALMKIHLNKKDILTSWLTQIEGISSEIMSLQTILKKAYDEFNHLYKCGIKMFMQLIKRNDETTRSLMTDLGRRLQNCLGQSKEELTSLIEGCKLEVQNSLHCFEPEICNFLEEWHIQIYKLYSSMEDGVSQLLNCEKYQLREAGKDLSCSQCLGMVYNYYSAWHMNLHDKLTRWNHQLESLNESSDELAYVTKSWFKELQTYPTLRDQQITSFLGSKKVCLQKLKTRKVLSEKQWSLLYPAKGFADLKQFDMTLISVLLMNTGAIQPHVMGWVNDFPDTDLSAGADIMRLKVLRNEYVAHIACTRLPPSKSDMLWSTVEGILYRLSAPIGEEFQKKIERNVADLKQVPYGSYKQELTKTYKSDQVDDIQLVTNDKAENRGGPIASRDHRLEKLPLQQSTLVNEMEDVKNDNNDDHSNGEKENASVESTRRNKTICLGTSKDDLNLDIPTPKGKCLDKDDNGEDFKDKVLKHSRHKKKKKKKGKKHLSSHKVREKNLKRKKHYRWKNIIKKKTQGSKLKNNYQCRSKRKLTCYAPETVEKINANGFVIIVTNQRCIIASLNNFKVLKKLCRQYLKDKEKDCGYLKNLYLSCTTKPFYLKNFTWNVFAQPYHIIALQPRRFIVQNDNRYEYECIRLISFFGYQGNGFGIRYAQAGFVSNPYYTMATCPWCGISVSDASNEVDLMTAHRSNCDFVRLPQINIPFSLALMPPLLSTEYQDVPENNGIYDAPSASAYIANGHQSNVRSSIGMALVQSQRLVHENDSPPLSAFLTHNRDDIESSCEQLAGGSRDGPVGPFDVSNIIPAPIRNTNLQLMRRTVSCIAPVQSLRPPGSRETALIGPHIYVYNRQDDARYIDDSSSIVSRIDFARAMNGAADISAIGMAYNGQVVNITGSRAQDQSSTAPNCIIRNAELPAPALSFINKTFTTTSDEHSNSGLAVTARDVTSLEETMRTSNQNPAQRISCNAAKITPSTSIGISNTQPSADLCSERNDYRSIQITATESRILGNISRSHNTAIFPSKSHNHEEDSTNPAGVMVVEELSGGKSNSREPAAEGQNARRQGILNSIQPVSALANPDVEPPSMNPNYSLKNVRTNPFHTLPAELRQRPVELAECGVCQADMEDTAGAIGGVVGEAESSVSSGDPNLQNYLLTDAAQSVLAIGYQPKAVLQAIERVLIPAGRVHFTGQTLLEAIFKIENEDAKNAKSQRNQSPCETNTGDGRKERDNAGD